MIRHATSRRRVLVGAIATLLMVPALALGSVPVHAESDALHAVYTETNSATAHGNAVLVYSRSASGALTPRGSVGTGGTGTGSGLGSQGAIILNGEGTLLFAVNAGSNTISSFRVGEDGPSLVSQVWSGGTRPISLTFNRNRLFVLNAGSSSIAGFWVSPNGALSSSPIPGSIEPLNPKASSPEEIAFNPQGDALVVPEKGSGQIDVYGVEHDGSVSGSGTISTGAVGPYAVAFTERGVAVVTDAGIGAATSYAVRDGTVETISSQVPDHHAAPCWIAITGNNRYAYVANAHDGTISSYLISPEGKLSVLQEIAAGPLAVPVLDLALSDNSHFLYAVDNGTIQAFTVWSNGSLTPLPAGSGFTAGQGLAAT